MAASLCWATICIRRTLATSTLLASSANTAVMPRPCWSCCGCNPFLGPRLTWHVLRWSGNRGRVCAKNNSRLELDVEASQFCWPETAAHLGPGQKVKASFSICRFVACRSLTNVKVIAKKTIGAEQPFDQTMRPEQKYFSKDITSNTCKTTAPANMDSELLKTKRKALVQASITPTEKKKPRIELAMDIARSKMSESNGSQTPRNVQKECAHDSAPSSRPQLPAQDCGLMAKDLQRLMSLGAQQLCYRGLNVQRPWARLLLSGVKTVEARKYTLKKLKKETLWLIETPGKPGKRFASLMKTLGGLAPPGNWCKKDKAKIIGTVSFNACFQYASREQWISDRCRHCIPEGSEFDWKLEDGHMYGWVVGAVQTLQEPQPCPEKRGMILSKAVMRAALFESPLGENNN